MGYQKPARACLSGQKTQQYEDKVLEAFVEAILLKYLQLSWIAQVQPKHGHCWTFMLKNLIN